MIVRGGGGGGTVMYGVFKGENCIDGTIHDRRNDQLENPSTSLDAKFHLVSAGCHGIIFDR